MWGWLVWEGGEVWMLWLMWEGGGRSVDVVVGVLEVVRATGEGMAGQVLGEAVGGDW